MATSNSTPTGAALRLDTRKAELAGTSTAEIEKHDRHKHMQPSAGTHLATLERFSKV